MGYDKGKAKEQRAVRGEVARILYEISQQGNLVKLEEQESQITAATEALEERQEVEKDARANLIGKSVLDKLLKQYLNNSFRRLFQNSSEQKLSKGKEIYQYRSQAELADLNSYYAIEIQSIQEAVQIVNQLNSLESIEIAYIEPSPVLAGDISPTTPDYTASQLYLNQAPAGIDALYAQTLPGGDGTGIKIVDIEGNWQRTHEDLDKATSGFLVGDLISYRRWHVSG